jgi:hypothetical protein
MGKKKITQQQNSLTEKTLPQFVSGFIQLHVEQEVFDVSEQHVLNVLHHFRYSSGFHIFSSKGWWSGQIHQLLHSYNDWLKQEKIIKI